MVDASHVQDSPLLDEAAYLALWQEHALHTRAPRDAAYEGGLLADRLAWVFVAGYQAAVRSIFPEVQSTGWLAFAASEDTEDPEQHPPVEATADESEWLLSGCKSWVAQSAHVSELVVTAKLRDRTELFRVASDIKGLTLTHRDAPKFLAAMSQGFARFDETPAARLDDPDRRRSFMVAEALAMMLAATGYVQRHTAAEQEPAARALRQLGECVAPLGDNLDLLAAGDLVDPKELRAIDERWQTALQDWIAATDTDALPEFAVDAPLLTLYRRGIANRAERAAITVGESPSAGK